MLASDDAPPGENLPEEIVERGVGAGAAAGLGVVHHHVDVDVAIARVAKARDGEAMLFLQPRGEAKQFLQPPAWDDDVFVQLRQAGVTEAVAEFAAQAPEPASCSLFVRL